MATPFSDIFEVFLLKITDYSFLNLKENELEGIELRYLQNAITKFSKCQTDLEYDKDNKTFINELKAIEIQILGCLMVAEWLDPQIYNITLLKQTLNDNTYKIHSQAAHLESLMKLRDKVKEESDSLIVGYTFAGDIEDLS